MSDRALAWPIGIVTGLAVVVVANAIMIGIALSNPSTKASEDHWAEAMAWDQELERRAQSRALGWSLARLERDGENRLVVRVIDREGAALLGLEGSLALQRSDSAAHDRELALVELGEGRYRSDAAVPAGGLFELRFELHDHSGATFVQRQRLELDALEVR